MNEEMIALLFDLFKEGYYHGVKIGAQFGEDELSPSEVNQRCEIRFRTVLAERNLGR
jgi:hypothetical protein